MKLFLLSAFALTLATPAFAADKICFFSRGGNGGAGHGDHFQAKITNQKVVISQSSSNTYDGSYKRGDDVRGHDGETYLDYDLGGEEGCNSILVNRKLLTSSGQGLMKFRCRGEGFDEDVFFCRNDRPQHEPAE